MTKRAKSASAGRVLLIEDEPHIRALARMILEDAGYDIDEAGDGDQGVAAIKARPHDVIVLDIMMPGRDGYGVLEAIESMPSRKGTPVIVVTAKHDPRGVLRELSGGAVDHLAKPFAPEALVAAVARAIEGSSVEERRGALWRSALAYDAVGILRSGLGDTDDTPAARPRGRR